MRPASSAAPSNARPRRLPRATCFALCIAFVSAACNLSDSDLAAFESTATGPEKLRAVLGDTHRTAELRARAGLRLLDLPRRDVDGRAMLFADLSRLPQAARDSIVPTFARGLIARMRTGDGAAPSPAAIRAKDAGVELLAMLDGDAHSELGQVLLRFMADDVLRRADVGRYQLEDVAKRVGRAGVPTLTAALVASAPEASIARLSAIIAAHADAQTRPLVASRLADVERALSSGPGSAKGRSNDLELVLSAIGRFADQSTARQRLLEVARDAGRPETSRTLALGLLENHIDEADLPALLALATDAAAPPAVRLLATSRAGETRSRKALAALLALLADRAHPELRRRAGELVLEMAVPEAASAFFRTLPSVWDMRYDRAEIDAYAERLQRLPREMPLVMLLGEKLHSSFWWNRVLALRYFAVRGNFEDTWRIRQHVADTQPVFGNGFPRAHTVGQEADAALAIALERFRGTGATYRPPAGGLAAKSALPAAMPLLPGVTALVPAPAPPASSAGPEEGTSPANDLGETPE